MSLTIVGMDTKNSIVSENVEQTLGLGYTRREVKQRCVPNAGRMCPGDLLTIRVVPWATSALAPSARPCCFCRCLRHLHYR
jgi:hypothetical protein